MPELNHERRANTAPELRAAGDDGDRPKIVGYVAVFNQLSEDLGGFRERIQPGAFAETIVTDDIRAVWNHDSSYVLGRTTNDTLKLWEDDRGLRYEIDPPATTWADDAITTIKRGDVDQTSFGFFARRDSWGEEGGELIRDLITVSLFDVSPVTFPAYPQTSTEARSKAKSLSTPDPDLAISDETDPTGEAADRDLPANGDAQARGALNRWRLDLADRE